MTKWKNIVKIGEVWIFRPLAVHICTGRHKWVKGQSVIHLNCNMYTLSDVAAQYRKHTAPYIIGLLRKKKEISRESLCPLLYLEVIIFSKQYWKSLSVSQTKGVRGLSPVAQGLFWFKRNHCVQTCYAKWLLPVTFHSSKMTIYVSVGSVQTPKNWMSVNWTLSWWQSGSFSEWIQ